MSEGYIAKLQKKASEKLVTFKEDLYKKTSISNLKIDSEYSFRKTKDNYIIEIDGTATKDSKKEYQITYEYNYGKDSTDEYEI